MSEVWPYLLTLHPFWVGMWVSPNTLLPRDSFLPLGTLSLDIE